MRKSMSRAGVLALLFLASVAPAFAGVVVYENPEKNQKVEIGGRIQLLYLRSDAIGGETQDFLNFRRLRPYIAGSVTESWYGKFQFDFGKAEDANEVAVKDAYMQYQGWDWGKLTLGNAKPGFSREFMTSSKEQLTIERTFVGDHNFGTPDRIIGFHLAGHGMEKKAQWQVSVGAGAHDPDLRRIDLDSPANNAADWNEGILAAGRFDFHPFGYLKKTQTNFDREMKMTFGVGAYLYSDDGDNTDYLEGGFCTSGSKCDLETADGLEISAAFRGSGFSLDAEYQSIHAELYDKTVDGGLYENGETTLDKLAIEGGYLLPGNQWEISADYQSMDADYFQKAWTRYTFGLNYYWNKSKVKAMLNFTQGSNINGIDGNDTDNVLAMMQYVF